MLLAAQLRLVLARRDKAQSRDLLQQVRADLKNPVLSMLYLNKQRDMELGLLQIQFLLDEEPRLLPAVADDKDEEDDFEAQSRHQLRYEKLEEQLNAADEADDMALYDKIYQERDSVSEKLRESQRAKQNDGGISYNQKDDVLSDFQR